MSLFRKTNRKYTLDQLNERIDALEWAANNVSGRGNYDVDMVLCLRDLRDLVRHLLLEAETK